MFADRTIQMIEMGLKASSTRRDVIANNIANVDVPHFKRSEVAFEAELKRAIDKEQAVKQEPLLKTVHPEHVARRQFRMPESVRPAVHVDYNSSMRNDGNNVDIEDETMKVVRNQLQYSLLVDRIGSRFSQWNAMIRIA
jgi:flagellar basal-body rod protein FlgB